MSSSSSPHPPPPSSSSSSVWSLPSQVISSDLFYQKALKPLCDALLMTQDPRIFPRWIPATIQKCFKWADMIKQLTETALDSVQLTIATTQIPKFHLSFVDDHPQLLLTHPHEMVIRILLNSPLLPMCEERIGLLQCCYQEGVKRLKLIPTQTLFATEHANIVKEKHQMGTWLLQLSHSNECIHPDDIYLSSQLLLACCSSMKDDGNIDGTMIQKMQQAIENDVTQGCLRMLCIGMSLSPATIYCCQDGSSMTTITLECITLVLNSPQLWNMLQEIARHHVVYFQCLEDIFPVFESLCARKDQFATIAKEAMQTMNTSSSSS